jgi:hypothetical protein
MSEVAPEAIEKHLLTLSIEVGDDDTHLASVRYCMRDCAPVQIFKKILTSSTWLQFADFIPCCAKVKHPLLGGA